MHNESPQISIGVYIKEKPERSRHAKLKQKRVKEANEDYLIKNAPCIALSTVARALRRQKVYLDLSSNNKDYNDYIHSEKTFSRLPHVHVTQSFMRLRKE